MDEFLGSSHENGAMQDDFAALMEVPPAVLMQQIAPTQPHDDFAALMEVPSAVLMQQIAPTQPYDDFAALMEVPSAVLMQQIAPTQPDDDFAALMEVPQAVLMQQIAPPQPDNDFAALMEVPPAVLMEQIVPAQPDDANFLLSFPVGYRFQPYDDELIMYYLKPKIANERLPPNLMHDVNVYMFNPETLAERYRAQGEGEWYFFTPRDRKYKNGERPNRAAGDGFWKATGGDIPIIHRGERVGSRKALAFHRGKPKESTKTHWIMHEYVVDHIARRKRLADSGDMKLDDWVLCRIFEKAENGPPRRQYSRSAPNNALTMQRSIGGQESGSPLESQSNTGQGIDNHSPTEGHETILRQGTDSPMQGQSNGGQWIYSPIEGLEAIFRQPISSLVEHQSHGGQGINSPVVGHEDIFMQEIKSLLESQSHGEQGIGIPIEGHSNGGQGINSSMASQSNVAQDQLDTTTLQPLKVIQNNNFMIPYGYGQVLYGLRDSNLQAQFPESMDFSANQTLQHEKQVVSNHEAQQLHDNRQDHGHDLHYDRVPENINGVLQSPSENDEWDEICNILGINSSMM